MNEDALNEEMSATYGIAERFRGFLPVVVDVETGGFNHETDALLEIAAVMIEMDNVGRLSTGEIHSVHVQPFPNANIEDAALAFTGIDPYHPFRFALAEKDALRSIFDPIRAAVKRHNCSRAILVGHNPSFDLTFLKSAVARTGIKRNPFHAFSTFDTATLCGLAYGQTVLARAAQAADIGWNNEEAHSALYDAQKTADLFCRIVNHWDRKN